MKNGTKALIAGCLCALAVSPFPSYASVSWETDSSVAGAAVALNNYYAGTMNPEEELAKQLAAREDLEAKAQTSPKAGAPVVTATQSAYSNVAISHVSNYVNVRTEANTDSEIVGKIYNNCAATILSTVDGEGGKWYQIQSGAVRGYIKAEYFITGAEAEKIAKKVGTMRATISTETLRLREEPNLVSKTLTLLSEDAEYEALEETGDFVKILVDSDLTGYVHKDYVNIRVEFKQAVTLEEEQKQKDETERLKREAQEALDNLVQVKKEAESAKETQTSAAEKSTDVPRETTAAKSASGTAGETGQTTAPATTAAIGTIAANPLETTAAQTAAPTTKAEETTKARETTKAPETTAKKTTAANEGYGPGGSGGPGFNYSDGPGSEAVTSATRTAIVAYAKQFLGNPYIYGGTSLTNGADCSGFTMRIYEHFGIDTGRTSRDQAVKGRAISVDAAQPGDLLFYASGDYINHVAMYIGGGQVIHASSSTTGIIISPAFYRTPSKAVTFLD